MTSGPETNHRVVLEYDGSRFSGWQIQPDQRTVQEELEQALKTLCREKIRVHGSGRTDAGVHARGQVASFHSASGLSPERLRKGLNGLTGDDLAVVELEQVAADFHARGSARGKIYVYRLLLRPSPSPLAGGWSWHLTGGLDLELLRRELATLPATADWSAYRAADCGARDPVKTLSRAEVHPEGNGVVGLVFEGSGFLKQMVRILVGTAVDVARGRLEEGAMLRIRDEGQRAQAGQTAPAHGLCLEEVLYSG